MVLFLAGGAVMGPVAPVQRPALIDLGVLTVPPDRLPSGCALEPTEPKTTDRQPGRLEVPGHPFAGNTENPWIGSDRRLAAAIRQRMEAGRPLVPDGPPLDQAAATAYALKWADNVREAYRAAYRSANGTLIEVLAVRFEDEALARPKPPAGTTRVRRGVSNRVEIGPTVVVVSAASTTRCFESISEHVASLR